MRSCLPLVLLLAFVGAACGGSDEGRPSALVADQEPATAEELCAASEGYESLSIIDFEPYEIGGGVTSTSIRCNPYLDSTCSLYFNYDVASSPPNSDEVVGLEMGEDCQSLAAAEGEEVYSSPRYATQTFEAAQIEGGRCGQEGWGQNIVTKNIGMCFGSDGRLGWSATLDVTFTPPLDAREWDGTSFWVKNSPNGERPAIIAQFADVYTSGGQDPETLEPTCDASDPAVGQQPVPDSEKCDSFGTAITLADEWTLVPARFEDLKQKGYGVVSPLGHLKTDEISKMTIFMKSGNADFWLDDIALFLSSESSSEWCRFVPCVRARRLPWRLRWPALHGKRRTVRWRGRAAPRVRVAPKPSIPSWRSRSRSSAGSGWRAIASSTPREARSSCGESTVRGASTIVPREPGSSTEPRTRSPSAPCPGGT